MLKEVMSKENGAAKGVREDDKPVYVESIMIDHKIDAFANKAVTRRNNALPTDSSTGYESVSTIVVGAESYGWQVHVIAIWDA